ncbi:hypothetical protein [Pricia antarctica]|uniref:hypothetical protein n=1 Tax=Pricia antarctica TaxID=641691 RepID=UPI001FE00F88|nr:hypothetical protein [Pricia antarctica]
MNGTELYDIEKDRMQLHNLAGKHPEIVQPLLADNADFLKEVKTNHEYNEFPTAILLLLEKNWLSCRTLKNYLFIILPLIFKQ